MSQYFCLFLIKCILLNIFISISLCDNISHLRIVFYNNSTLELDKYLDSNESVNGQNHNSSPKAYGHHTNEHNNQSTYNYQENCSPLCGPLEHCCRVMESIWICQDYNDGDCKGYTCNFTIDCDTNRGLECSWSHEEGQVNLEEKKCQCESGYYFDVGGANECVKNLSDSKTAMQIYKITMIFASCCLALILIIFLVCILRKSYCAPRNQHMVPLDNTTIPDIFTLFPHVGNYEGGPLGDGTQPPFEKPPTYDETLTLIRNEIGIPPPAYRSRNGSQSTNRSNQSTPQLSARVLITSPALVTVDSSSRSDSSVHSGQDLLVAGPSGSGASHQSDHSHQGIDNPAFC